MTLLATATKYLIIPKRSSERCLFNIIPNVIQLKSNYADIGIKKKVSAAAGKAGPTSQKKEFPVETDTRRLVEYVCGTNILKEGGEDVKLKPESEYPDWLWTLHTGKPKSLEELDPNTLEYWRKVRILAMRRNNRLSKMKYKARDFGTPPARKRNYFYY